MKVLRPIHGVKLVQGRKTPRYNRPDANRDVLVFHEIYCAAVVADAEVERAAFVKGSDSRSHAAFCSAK